ncbi:unnamed protein product [Vicia faba]|uniref:BHLH domain-containing protein n=1 Tax=Vicia faba TaxID=3906 RepID=A0AAV1AZL0_VICFA|nr:unnamed protein product [Vicia faba]
MYSEPNFDYNNFNLQNEQQHGFLNNNCSPQIEELNVVSNPSLDTSIPTRSRSKKRRVKTSKNEEEIENQRMTHIAVERNRRKQMNHYLSILRSLMPQSYVQRVDQASIIGGAINFVKNLEQRLQFLGVEKEKEGKFDTIDANKSKPFSEFFTFPQYSTSVCENASETKMGGEVHQSSNTIADIEVTMVESHANIKIRSKKRPKQLLKMVSSLHGMCLTILHLNVTTTHEFLFYSLSVKVEDDCKFGSVDEIASAVYKMLERIQQESILN